MCKETTRLYGCGHYSMSGARCKYFSDPDHPCTGTVWQIATTSLGCTKCRANGESSRMVIGVKDAGGSRVDNNEGAECGCSVASTDQG